MKTIIIRMTCSKQKWVLACSKVLLSLCIQEKNKECFKKGKKKNKEVYSKTIKEKHKETLSLMMKIHQEIPTFFLFFFFVLNI